LLVATLVLGLFFIIKNYSAPIGDFGNYYYGSKFLLGGNWGLWIYDVASFNLRIFDLGQRSFFLNYTPVPPFSAIVYLPFVGFKVEVAKAIWNMLNLTLLLFTLYRLNKEYSLPSVFWLFFPVLFFMPFRNNIAEGQSYFLLLFLLVEGFVQYQKGNLWLMAALWALAIHLKVSPAFVFLFLAFNKDFKAIFYLSLVGLFFLLVSFPFITIPVWVNYLFSVLPRLFNGEINDTYALNYQSMQVLLKTLFVPDVLNNKNAWFNEPMIYLKAILVFKFMIVGLSVLCSNSKKIEQPAKFGIWMLCSMLISGYGNSFSLLLLLLPTVYFYSTIKSFSAEYYIYVLLLLVAVNIPFYWFPQNFILFKFPRMFAMIGLFLILTYFSGITIKRHYLFTLLLVCFIPLKAQVFPQNYFFKKEEALLVYDFEVFENHLLINYFDFDGPSSKQVPIDFLVRQTKCFEMPPRSLGINGLKACNVNDSLTLYLSDENRGVGFYTMRKAEMGRTNFKE
jgi:hypothetical protein